MADREKNYMTPQGFQKLSDEFHQLARIERPKVTQLIAWAASNGDRSENADYIYGKRRLREIDRRMRFLKKRLDLAVIVDGPVQNQDKVQFGAKVTVMDESEQLKSYMIVGVDEIDLHERKISWKSPLGSSLIGKEVGDIVTFFSPKGQVELEIVLIEYQGRMSGEEENA